jgi:hypothetical protein
MPKPARSKNPRLSTVARMVGEVYDAITRTASRMIYQAAYALVLSFGGTSRKHKALADRLARKAQENAQKSTPAAISLFLNAFVLWTISTVALRPRFERQGPSISLVLGDENFFTKTDPQPAPPPSGGGGGNSALEQTLAEATKAMANPPTAPMPSTAELLAMTTISPATFEIPTPEAPHIHPEAVAQAIASLPSTPETGEETGTSTAGTGTAIGDGEGSGGTGPGTGTGSGGGHGSGTGQGTGPGNALFGGGVGKGTQGAPSGSGIRHLANWNVVVIVDLSAFIRGESTISQEELPTWFEIKEKRKRAGKGWVIHPPKENAFFLPALLAQRNVILDAIAVGDDMLDDTRRPGRSYGTIDDGYTKYVDLGRALPEVLRQYAGREHTCIVIGSEFQFETPKEVLSRIEALAKEAGLPLFFVSLAGKPDPNVRRMARATGGDYLGYLDGKTARQMAGRQPLITLQFRGDENEGIFQFEPTPYAAEFTLPPPTQEAPPLPQMEDRPEMRPGQEGYTPPQ